MLLQVDGSRHDWLEGRGPYLTLIGAIDDATGKVPYAVFREQEDAQGYFLLLSHIVTKEGIPLALYLTDMEYLNVRQRIARPWRSNLPGRRRRPSLAG